MSHSRSFIFPLALTTKVYLNINKNCGGDEKFQSLFCGTIRGKLSAEFESSADETKKISKGKYVKGKVYSLWKLHLKVLSGNNQIIEQVHKVLIFLVGFFKKEISRRVQAKGR